MEQLLIHLCLSNTFRESMSVFPMDMDVGDDLILRTSQEGLDLEPRQRHLSVAG